jgi:hypothetical protein
LSMKHPTGMVFVGASGGSGRVIWPVTRSESVDRLKKMR